MLKKFKVFLEMIKFEHTLFALPFAYMGAILGSMVLNDALPNWEQIGWITLAMVGARSAAMGLNRVIDKVIDAKNPRTAGRAIPAGLLSSKEVLLFIVVSLVILFIATSQLNKLCMELLPIAVFFLVIYSYTKRFTWACHLILGLTIALAPLGGWVAVTGKIDMVSLVFYFTVAFWTAGFDVIYACQDIEFDRKEGLYSIPSRFGIPRALLLAKLFHVLTAIGFMSLYFLTDLSWVYFAGIIIAYLILIYEHRLVSPKDLSKLNTAFFTMNGVLSVLMFTFTFIDLVVR
ncbi:4-hydroxybenzoate octaprenyltransferase [Paenibacillus psychroresistens]|uniref:4-hydroxybenzoate polyprenyltransferase n=1 Tax=Paenibacillus psychroresistens TaxID=1778678 RepID=A0A6B8RM92_9BACL|nr:UbiA-like polyprenyltransferase [Paenibacillus psychroresistens]QGQ96874.1 4-hydroxybenzoate octaprenyltransferase [Paenibacillus psychroresistens]